MRVLVVGGNGFIGSHVVDRLRAAGHAVRVFDPFPERYRDPLPGVDYARGSFTDRMAVIEALTDIDCVFHLASTTFPGTANRDPSADVRDNLIGSIGLIESMLDIGVRRILYLSSGGTVYGPAGGAAIREDHPLLPINSYGIVKVAIERYLEMFARSGGLQPLVIRASNPYGPRQGHTGVQGVVSTFLRRLRDGEPIEIWGDGTVVRDFFYVEDLADLCATAGTSAETGVFNAGSGKGTSLNELVAILSQVTGQQITPSYRESRSLDVPVSILDVSKAEMTFGWKAEVPLIEGIAQSWDWLKSLD